MWKPGKKSHKSLATYINPVAYQWKSSQQGVWAERWTAGLLPRKQYTRFCKLLWRWKMAETLAYLADIFHHMNQLKESLQGPGENVLTKWKNSWI